MINSDSTHDQSWKGVVWIILIDGLLRKGGIFALGMLGGIFLIKKYSSDLTIYDYLSSVETWVSFVYYFLFFGLIMGLFDWVQAKKTR